jgi:recombination DNA repair RAD52 pathway protein
MTEASGAPETEQVPFDEQGGIEDSSIPGEENIAPADLTDTEAGAYPPGVSILTEQQLIVLTSPLNKSRVANLQGNSYLKAWDVKASLIKVFGFGGFSADVIESSIQAVREYAAGPQYAGHTKRDGTPATPQVIAKATVRLTIYGIGPRGEDVTYTETAIGANSGFDIGDTMDNALKTASSAALKRCAIYLGTQFGLSLYNDGSTDDYVRRVFTPWQGKVIDDHREQRAAAAAAQVAQQLARATGGGS